MEAEPSGTQDAPQNTNRKRTLLLVLSGAFVLLVLFFAFTVFPPYSACRSGQRLQSAGSYAEAVAAYRKALSYRGKAPLSGLWLSDSVSGIVTCEIALAGSGAAEDALQSAEQIVQEAGLSVARQNALLCSIYAARADACIHSTEYDAAAALYERAAALASGDANRLIYQNRAVVCSALSLTLLGDYGQAIDRLTPIRSFENVDSLLISIENVRSESLSSLFEKSRDRLAAGAWYTAAAGAAPLFAGDPQYTLSDVADADRVYSGVFNAIFVKDGKVSGLLGSGMGSRAALESLSGVAKASAGLNHILVLKTDGTVQSFGSAAFEKRTTADWSDIADVAAGGYHSLGLRADGSVLACGSNAYGQCDVSDWTDVAQVAAGLFHSVGLRSDGTAVACGDNADGQCDVSGWTDLLAVYAGANHTIGLRSDFTLVSTGSNGSGQCDVTGWTDIVSVACGVWHTVGLRADGTVAFAGSNANGQADVASWQLFSVPAYPTPAPHAESATAAKELIYSDFTRVYGPWLYLSPTGAINICYDDTVARVPVRADLISASGSLPFGAFAELDTNARNTARPARIARQNKAVFAQTGDFLAWGSNPKGVMIRGGIVFYENRASSIMAFLPNGEMRVYDPGTITAPELLALGVENSWSFGPILVQDGALNQNLFYFSTNSYNGARNAIGMVEPGHYIAIVTSTGLGNVMNASTLAEVFVHYGCKTAYNLDGGHSAAMTFMGESINYQGWSGASGIGRRAISDMLAFVTSDSLPGVDEPYRDLAKDFIWEK